ncbi:hypothetical protein PSTT_08930 [Puccinia striiformis]|uniref:Uncharacterized protein n=2 Tax=Puccinia striiformis TaxID=27350 RepID=A0A2S4VAG4_9BASI|nr:hypothetical protein PSTT_08930 [Puccinia striiformis]
MVVRVNTTLVRRWCWLTGPRCRSLHFPDAPNSKEVVWRIILWSALQDATSDTDQLKALLYQCPRLLQISGTHPFFNKNYLKMDVLSKAIDRKLGSDIRSRSWFSLNLLMCGTSTSSQPDPKSDFARQNEISLKRLLQTTRDATLLLQTFVRPAEPQRTESNED